MIKQANILFIHSSLSGNDFGLRNPVSRDAPYQQLIYSSVTRSIYTKEGFESLGRQLAAIAIHAYLSRQMDAVEQVSQLMLALPISNQLKAVARYYQAICTKKKGDFQGARLILEGVLEEAPPRYKARALLSIGATYFDSGEVESSIPFYLSAGRAAREYDPLTLAQSQWMTAVVRGIYGDHKQALDALERLFPMVRALGKHHPALYYHFLNSLAVELGEVGRIAEAEAAIGIVLASPFAAAYPEVADTRDEIAAKRVSATHSVVAVRAVPETSTSPQPQLGRKTKQARALKLSWPARLKISLQISVIAIAGKVIARHELTRSILDRVHNNARPRGPPALSHEVFRLIEENVGTERSHLITQSSCAKDCHQPVAISFGVSSIWRGRTICYWLHLQAHDHQQLQAGRVLHHKVNPHSQTRKLRMVWAGCRGRDSPPHSTVYVRVKEFVCRNSHVRMQKDGYEYTRK